MIFFANSRIITFFYFCCKRVEQIITYANTTIPKITVILRKSYGGAYIVMGSKHLGADFVFAWPSAQIAVMGSKGAVQILHGRKLKSIEDKTEREEKRTRYQKEYEQSYLNPFTAAESGYVDAIIEPNETRKHLIRALSITREKVESMPKRKNGNITL